MKEMLKNMFGLTIGAVIGGEAIRQVGGIAAMPRGLRTVTQTGIGLGLVGMAAKPLKKIKLL